MSALEQEIYEKFQQLDDEAKQRVRATLAATDEQMSTDAWLTWARQYRATLSAKYGRKVFNSVDLLNEAREERLNDLMGGH